MEMPTTWNALLPEPNGRMGNEAFPGRRMEGLFTARRVGAVRASGLLDPMAPKTSSYLRARCKISSRSFRLMVVTLPGPRDPRGHGNSGGWTLTGAIPHD